MNLVTFDNTLLFQSLQGGKGTNAGNVLNIVSADGDRLVDGPRVIGAVVIPFLIFALSIILGIIVIGWPTLLGIFQKRPYSKQTRKKVCEN